MPLHPIRFIGEAIEAHFDKPPLLAKAPPCPNAFTWQGQTFHVIALLREWHDYQRRGRMARNMRPEHAQRAATRGSWGVGRYHFQVRAITPETLAANGQVFELYFDRAPVDVDHRHGQWFLVSELAEA